MDEIIYTPHLTEVSYRKQYPDMIEFARPWECCIQVGQGCGKISKDGQTLQSEGFSFCSGLILKDKKTLESALFHIDEWDLPDRSCPTLEEFMVDYISRLDIGDKETNQLIDVSRYIAFYRCPSNYGRMKREEFQEIMEKLNETGDLTGQFIFGTVSRHTKNRIVDNMLKYFGVKVQDDILVKTGQVHWDVVYKPKESTIFVNNGIYNKVLSYNF